MTILIVGDSWGCGEWDINSSYNPHRGLEQYLREDGYDVVNISKGGISNLDIVNRIAYWFSRNPDVSVDKVFVFQTEFSRDYKHSLTEQNYFGADDWNISTTQELIDKWVERFYQRLSDVAQNTQCKIFILGGGSDTKWFDNMSTDYPGCQIACQSITNLILTQNHKINQPVFGWFTRTTEPLVKKLKSCTDVSNLTDLITLGMERELLLRENPGVFFPDGSHPNRLGHKILFNFLKQEKFIP